MKENLLCERGMTIVFDRDDGDGGNLFFASNIEAL
jgi:hypothetical protein